MELDTGLEIQEWVRLYDVFSQPPWFFFLGPFIPLVMGIGLWVILGGRWIWAGQIGLALGLLGTLLIAWLAIDEVIEVKKAYETHSYSIAEGYTENFISALDGVNPATGRKGRPESFDISGQYFSYHHRSFHCFCYNRTEFDGGPQLEGRYLRIRHLEGNILRIEFRLENPAGE